MLKKYIKGIVKDCMLMTHREMVKDTISDFFLSLNSDQLRYIADEMDSFKEKNGYQSYTSIAALVLESWKEIHDYKNVFCTSSLKQFKENQSLREELVKEHVKQKRLCQNS